MYPSPLSLILLRWLDSSQRNSALHWKFLHHFSKGDHSSKRVVAFLKYYMSRGTTFSIIYMCGQRRLRSDCASAQSDLSLHCPSEEDKGPWLHRECQARTPISVDAQVDLSLHWPQIFIAENAESLLISRLKVNTVEKRNCSLKADFL